MLETVRPRRTANDGSLVEALNVGPVAMAFEIKGGFSYYKSGVLSVQDCGSVPHHAMGVTGYTPEFFEIKNSWGSTWGDGGYVRFAREIFSIAIHIYFTSHDFLFLPNISYAHMTLSWSTMIACNDIRMDQNSASCSLTFHLFRDS